MTSFDTATLIDQQIATSSTGWAIGAFGAIGEFMRDVEEPVELAANHAVTKRGAIALASHPASRVIAYETSMGDDAWAGAIAICLPMADAQVASHTTLTELGEDRDAIQPAARRARLFDMGLGLPHIQACVRSDHPAVIDELRRFCGHALFTDGIELFAKMPALSPHRVFISRLGRAEIYQAIPTEHGKTPEGPHTHVLPKLLRARRTHAADVPIPDGWVACATLYPANPLRDVLGRPKPFARAELAAWRSLFDAHGLESLRAVKRSVIASVEQREAPQATTKHLRAERLAIRVALRQHHATHGDSPALAAWRAAFDRPHVAPDDGLPGHYSGIQL